MNIATLAQKLRLTTREVDKVENSRLKPQSSTMVTSKAFAREMDKVESVQLISQTTTMLTPRLTALIAGLNTTKTLENWVSRGGAKIPVDKEERLRTAYIICELLKSDYSDRIIRQWFVGSNHGLNTSPALAIRNQRFEEAIEAAKEFLISEI